MFYLTTHSTHFIYGERERERVCVCVCARARVRPAFFKLIREYLPWGGGGGVREQNSVMADA